MEIILAPFEKQDIQRLVSWVDSKELLLRWAGNFFQFPLDENQCEQYLATAYQSPPARLIFKAKEKDTNHTIGHIELDGFDMENQSAFICRVLVGDNAVRGQGIGEAIVRQTIDFAFENLEIHRLAVGVLESNHSAIRCYEKCGFQREGIFRDIVKYDQQYYSLVSMSMLRSEWRVQKQG